MKMNRSLRLVALAALLAWPVTAVAQTPGAGQKVELLFVQNGTGVAVEKNTLRLKNVGASTLFFTDRPVRIAGHYHTKGEFLKLWSEGPDSFAKNPPNATLSFVEPGRPQLLDVVINIRNPRMQGADLLYDFNGHAVRVPAGYPHRASRATPCTAPRCDAGARSESEGGPIRFRRD